MRKLIILFITIILLKSTYAQLKNDSILVDLGSRSITTSEFIKRFELNPWPSRNLGSKQLEAKTDFLYSLIGEKLLSIAAEELKIDTIFMLNNSLRNLEKMLVRDALYKKEIKSKVAAPKNEVDLAFQRALRVNYIKFVESKDSIEINNLKNIFNKGISFDTILIERPEYLLQKEPVAISFGTMPPELENLIYSSKAGEISKPIFSDGKFYIFKIDSILDLSNSKEIKFNELYQQVEKKFKERKEKNEFRKYFSKFFSDKKGKIEENIFSNLLNSFYSLVKEKNFKIDSLGNKTISIQISDIEQIENAMKNRINLSLFYADTTKISCRDFLYRILTADIQLKDSSYQYLTRYLLQKIRSYIADEFLSNEGYRQNLQNSPEVIEDINLWKESYFSNAMNLIIKERIKVSDSEIDSVYKINLKNVQSVNIYKIQEILVDSLEQIEELFKKLSENEDFGKLAQKYSKREWSKKFEGNFGYITESMYGMIGETAPKLSIGEIYGPIKVDSGYSIIKLLDKKEKNALDYFSDKEERNRIRYNIFQKKYNSTRDKLVTETANKYLKNINYDLLKSIETMEINLMVYRYYGFGGKTTGVPMLFRYNSWFDVWKQQKEQNP